MTDYRLMPEEATPEMEQAVEKYWNDRKFKALSDDPRTWKGLYAAMRAAAPDVQGEPVAWMTHHDEPMFLATAREASAYCDHDENPIPLYAAPQPAEQQPLTSSLAYDASIHLTNWLNMNLCECEGGHTCGYTEVRRTRDALLAVAEQQPDVAQPVEHQFPSSYPVSGNVYFRESTGEWVLEITASINGTRCTARHVQPAETRPEDVVGLPALYESTPDITQLVEALRMLAVAGNRLNDEAEECTYDDGVAEVASVDFWGDFREALEAADAALAPTAKGVIYERMGTNPVLPRREAGQYRQQRNISGAWIPD